MPNWCECELRVYGPKAEIARFKEKARGVEDSTTIDLDANSFVPYPQKFLDQDVVARKWREDNVGKQGINWGDAPNDGLNSGGYEWCIANWGTKWGFCHSKLENESPKRLFYRTSTAWSPPIPLISAMGEMFPKLHFVLRYWEGGIGYQGRFEVKGGVVVEDMGGDYSGSRGG